MNTQQKIKAIAEEKAGYEATVAALKLEVDTAADAGDMAHVKHLQAEIAAIQELVASCDRRSAKEQTVLLEESRAAQRKANDDALVSFRAALKRLPPHAYKIGKIIASLAAELEAFHAAAREAHAGAYHLATQAEKHQGHDFGHLCTSASFTDETLGFCVLEEIRKAGIFTRIAPTVRVLIPPLGLPPIGEAIEKRIESVEKRVEAVHSIANATIK